MTPPLSGPQPEVIICTKEEDLFVFRWYFLWLPSNRRLTRPPHQGDWVWEAEEMGGFAANWEKRREISSLIKSVRLILVPPGSRRGLSGCHTKRKPEKEERTSPLTLTGFKRAPKAPRRGAAPRQVQLPLPLYSDTQKMKMFAGLDSSPARRSGRQEETHREVWVCVCQCVCLWCGCLSGCLCTFVTSLNSNVSP